MNTTIIDDNTESENVYKKVQAYQTNKILSLFWELKTILYLGIVLLTTGLGIIIYKNIDTIGHTAIVIFVAVVCGISFYYCYKNNKVYSNTKVLSPNIYFDYVLLLACLTLGIFISYIQYQYNFFGNHYGLATFLPMLILFFSAYWFDNIGILSLAITAFAAWAGISVMPTSILKNNDFDNLQTIFTAFFVGALLVSVGYFTVKKDVKKHFEFTYNNFGINLLFISTLAAMFHFDGWCFVIIFLLAVITYLVYEKSIKEKSFYFLLLVTLYTYIAVSYIIGYFFFKVLEGSIETAMLMCMYFIVSAVGIIVFLIRMNKKLKAQ